MTVLTTFKKALTEYKDEECAICFDEYTGKTPVYLLGCKHLIHQPCLGKLVVCPFCRTAIAPILQETSPPKQSFFTWLFKSCVSRPMHKD